MPNDPKTALRQQCKDIRNSLGNETRRAASEAICAHIAGWQVFQYAQTILTYMPMRAEVDLTPLLARFPSKRWVLPRIIPEENHRMVFHPYDPARLVIHPFGMAEPAADSPQIGADGIELVLVPGLAYDKSGWRLGYGGGYFDRFLSNFAGVSAGVVFEALLFDSLPRAEHDVPVNWIATERGIVQSAHSH